MSSTWLSVPRGIERWSLANAATALFGAAVSLALSELWPSLIAAVGSIAYCFRQYAPERTAGLNLANLVTAGRLAALVVVLATRAHEAGLVAIVAGLVYVLDGVDGWLARRREEVSAFGAHFDMETDGHVVLLSSLYLAVNRGLGWWVIAFGALRYLYVIARALVAPERRNYERRSIWSRWVFTLVSLSLALACAPAWTEVTKPLLVVALVALCASFAPDFAALVRRAPHSTIA